ncbi:MAG: SGNH/GDSL hydrolase family protein [Bdellovibrionota bacterium]
MKKIFRSPPFFALVFFIALELVSTLILSGMGNSLDKTRKIVLPDESLGWRQAWNLNTTFLDKTFTTDAKGFRKNESLENAPRILFLGPSSTAGWGVHDHETYPALMGKNFFVQNAGQIGYSSYQGMKLFENELASEKYDVVVIAYGINDVDMHRFYFQSPLTDAEELREQKEIPKVSFQKMINHSSLLGVMQKLAFKLISLTGKGKLPHEDMQKLIRVKEDEFRKNFTTMIDEIRVTGAIPVILSTATHFKKSNDPEVTFQQDLVIGRMKNYSRILKELAAEKKVSLAHPDIWLVGNRDVLFVDPVHFSVSGNQLIATGLGDMIGRIVNKGAADGK